MEGHFGHGVWFTEGARARLLEAIEKLREGLRIVKYTREITLDEDRVRLSQESCDEVYSWVYRNLPFAGTTFLPIKEARELRSHVNLLENESDMFAGLVFSCDNDDNEDRYLAGIKKDAIENFRLAQGYFCHLY